ncbi:MAG TPA: hypothetical protein DEQ47_06890 [Solibacterales bacterium]|jgi:hypothetical protein|nr:hypothetical protein [Bryobacterales bacterium]
MEGAAARREISMKREPDFFEGHDPQLIYIAKRLDDALQLEDTLTRAGVDYGVEADQFTAGVIFRGERVGAFFYVLPKDLDAAIETLRAHGYKPARLN